MRAQVFKKKDVDADELMGLSSAKRGGKKSKKGAEKPAEKPVRPLPTLCHMCHRGWTHVCTVSFL